MAIWGKILGGTLGMMFGGPIGALLGAAGGHWWDKQKDSTGNIDAQQKSIAFSVAVVAMAAKMAKVDGRVSREEIKVFKQIFRFDANDEQSVTQIYREAQKTATGFHDYAMQAAEIIGRGSPVLEEFLWALAEIAKADNHLHEAEMRLLREAAETFGLSPQVFARIAALESDGHAADPYTVLGISQEASNTEIKAHYRHLVREHHPDRLIAQGLPEEAIALSTKKLAAINQAYDQISDARGIT